MAEFDLQLAVAFGTQSVLGTADSTIAALSGSIDSSDGIVLGDPESGINESGLSYQAIRSLREKAVVSGSFTTQPSDFLGELVEGFSVSFPLKGNGATATPSDSEYTPLAGIDAILQTCGLTGGAWGSGDGWEYVPASSQIVTAKIFDSGMFYVIKDIVGNLSISWEPGSIAVATATLAGVVDDFGAVSFPTLDYTTQASLTSPSVAEVAHNWGISDALRGFTTATTTIDNQTEDVPDSNAEGGKRVRQTGRTISHTATVYSDDGDLDFERTELIRETTPTEELTFTVGTAAGATDTINAITMSLPNPETRAITPNVGGTSRTLDVELVAVDTVADAEFALRFV
jgi:hypothetical protein